MILEIDLTAKHHNDKTYEGINSSVGSDALLYSTLSERLKQSNISEEALMEWSRFVKLASHDAKSINQLEEFAVIKILRSWKSIEGIIRLAQANEQ